MEEMGIKTYEQRQWELGMSGFQKPRRKYDGISQVLEGKTHRIRSRPVLFVPEIKTKNNDPLRGREL